MARNPDGYVNATISRGEMEVGLGENKFQRTSANDGPQRYALGIATVSRVDYEKLEVNLVIETGEKFQNISIPLTFPGAGSRHFLGALPMPGDACVIGWGMGESGRTRQPYILSWIIPGVTAGYDWWPKQPYQGDEFGMTPKDRHYLEGVANRIRHKLRHMEPGGVYASSAQGSDLILDESVTLMNRRGNEVRLRDHDQAFLVRSLQQFHAGAGFRVYGGMVQRDANLLPTQMFSDGRFWDQPQQIDAEGNALPGSELGPSPYAPGSLTPERVFQRDSDAGSLSGLVFPVDVDPYDFLQRGLFIDKAGNLDATGENTAVYGGKPMYRVSSDPGKNGVVDTSSPTFTEYRIEVAHTSDGTLPVTEQTDGFDADRLPSTTTPDDEELESGLGFPISETQAEAVAFIEFVLGTVVGNDPFTSEGSALYGLPLAPVVFDGSVRSPKMVSGLGLAVDDHAATLFRLNPPVTTGSRPTFWSTTKSGRFLASIAGPPSEFSAELSLGSGLRMGAGSRDGESFVADFEGATVIRSRLGRNLDNLGVLITSDSGAVKVFAGGTTQEGGPAFRTAPSGGGESDQPALTLESATSTLLKATRKIRVSANTVSFENMQVGSFTAATSLDFQSGDGISHSSNTYVQSTTGKATFNYGGPKDQNPANGALRETQFTSSNPVPGFTVDKYRVAVGSRDEVFTAGNHNTTVVVGNQTYSSAGGQVTLASGGLGGLAPTNVTLSPGSLTGRSPTVSWAATGGAMSLSATALVSVSSGVALTMTAPKVSFLGPHLPPGAVLTDGCINPLTGTPFAVSGVLGVPTITVGV